MKKLNYLFVSLFIIAALASCTKDDGGPIELKCNTVKVVSGPVAYVTPYIIPGPNNGGNRTCADVEAAFNLPAGFFMCGEKIDYDNGNFAGSFPDGLIVTVTDGTYVSFEIKDCIELDGRFYKIGAVIVKGGNDANVYYYDEGSYGDVDLASPVNASGKPAGLSNLSFCFVECEQQHDLVIAFKSYLTQDWACTATNDILFVGYYDFVPNHNGYKIYYTANTNPVTADMSKPVGNLTISDIDHDGLWEVTVDNSDMPDVYFTDAYLFVGSLEDYFDSYFRYFPNHIVPASPSSSVTFDLTF